MKLLASLARRYHCLVQRSLSMTKLRFSSQLKQRKEAVASPPSLTRTRHTCSWKKASASALPMARLSTSTPTPPRRRTAGCRCFRRSWASRTVNLPAPVLSHGATWCSIARRYYDSVRSSLRRLVREVMAWLRCRPKSWRPDLSLQALSSVRLLLPLGIDSNPGREAKLAQTARCCHHRADLA